MGLLTAALAWLAKPAAATLVSAGSAAISTIAQTNNANKMANQGTDLGKLRAEAEANGFNPLTVLRATGGAGFKQDVNMGSGALASAAFFNNFAGLGNNIAEAKQREASLKNTLASTANYTAQTRALSTAAQDPKRSRHDIPLMVNVYDDEGNVEEFKIVNPELIETSGGEIAASLAVLAAQYSAQHNVSYEKAYDLVSKAQALRRDNVKKDPFNIVTKQLPAADVPGSFKPGILSLDWFKQKIDNATGHPMLPNNYMRNGL